ncbi:MAG: hypothetical protein Q9219_007329 [cf. Caloplaca sp. 3 TL-2023]
MSKKSITDFFKPFAHPHKNKRPPSEDEPELQRASQRSCSKTPQATTGRDTEQTRAFGSSDNAPLTPSQCSTLNSIQNLPSSTLEQWFSFPMEDSIVRHERDQSHAVDGTASQGPIISSSQRTIRNGEVIIQDSDDERSGTDISLDDLDDILTSRMTPHESISFFDGTSLSVPSSQITRPQSPKNAGKSCSGSSRSTADKLPKLAGIPKFKFSLGALVEQRQADDESRLSIESAKCMLNYLEERNPQALGIGNQMLDENLLATIIRTEDEGPDVGSLMGAIERTEALHLPKDWLFFNENCVTLNVDPPNYSPVVDQYWNNVFEDPIARQQAFLGGYIGECVPFRKFSKDLIHWLLESALQQFNNEKLTRLLNVYQAVACSMNQQVRAHTLCTLSRMLLDRQIVNDSATLSKIEDIISIIVDCMVNERLDKEVGAALVPIYHSVKDLSLQLRLLRHLPASSSQLCLLRRQLAFAFFFHNQAYLSKEGEQLVDFKTILRRLDGPEFTINSDTNYPNLAASVAILAIGLDNGNPTFSAVDEEAERAFCGSVDVLAQKIKLMFTQIIDTGASHVRRTEAKEVLESFHSYLVYAVRIRQRPRGVIWDDNGQTKKQRTVMNGFIQLQAEAHLMNTNK